MRWMTIAQAFEIDSQAYLQGIKDCEDHYRKVDSGKTVEHPLPDSPYPRGFIRDQIWALAWNHTPV